MVPNNKGSKPAEKAGVKPEEKLTASLSNIMIETFSDVNSIPKTTRRSSSELSIALDKAIMSMPKDKYFSTIGVKKAILSAMGKKETDKDWKEEMDKIKIWTYLDKKVKDKVLVKATGYKGIYKKA